MDGRLMMADTDEVNMGDVVVYELFGGAYKSYFYVHNIIGEKIIASGICRQNGYVFKKDDDYYFQRKANREEIIEFERSIKRFNKKFDKNLGVIE